MKKIIVHNGQFHADDVMAAAILRCILEDNVPVERKNNISSEELMDFDICVVDVGGVYEPALNNFDHHQNPDLQSACVLVAEKFICGDILPMLRKQLLIPISDCDRGIKMNEPATLNSIIASFNSIIGGFDIALRICEEIFTRYYFNAIKSLEDERRWDSLIKGGGIAIQLNNDIILSWRSLAERDGIQFLVCPSDREPGQWNLISRDSKLFPIPADDKQVFLHSNKFMAVYSSFYDATHAILTGDEAQYIENTNGIGEY
jgi:hypothetical protein